ncbi:uncharacterized protein KY384_005432 [Bacidia gigantensis]|uniref:uncharacterized protein n=1 Tax=Bacidia gigantensis TaxID=2732470 RepID=UPI001D047147|nr:uncharacterized protein KY384_005432 [Bacidia gigantensis]KAG8529951.1 hypothetical protein KY384_005432 [Bacidia gigantensis]
MARTKAGVEVQKQIYYVPTQVDPLAIASKRALRQILLVKLIVLPMEGPRIVYSEVDDTSKSTVSQHKGERWVFINGCACGQGNFQGDVNRLAQVFGRQVMGIHNQTYGLLADILECLVQRVFAYTTTDVRVAYEQIKVIICDPWVSKVILIGHSQGGIIISLVLDELFSELPASIMSKLEVYTFGSAASHFSNPPMSTVAVPEKDEHFTISKGLKRSRYVISHVEQ